MPFSPNIFGKLIISVKESKWCSPWCKPYIPFWWEGIPVSKADRLETTSNSFRKWVLYWFCVLPWRTTAYRCIRFVENKTFSCQFVQVRCLADFVSVGTDFKTAIVSCNGFMILVIFIIYNKTNLYKQKLIRELNQLFFNIKFKLSNIYCPLVTERLTAKQVTVSVSDIFCLCRSVINGLFPYS